ncbi:hypothetical protein J2S55_004885 [Streptosporangium brasiliense]|uniref:Uncharacterized protein n=1 Tax=Streptosporangium brasiliense TaxID=47480 RepID=A0ABT9R8R8_9ACTN|nr:hypothetical protein [Streptosporangium brasiliense]
MTCGAVSAAVAFTRICSVLVPSSVRARRAMPPFAGLLFTPLSGRKGEYPDSVDRRISQRL